MTNITRRQFCIVGTAAALAALGLGGCASTGSGSAAGSLKDGTYTGESSVLDIGADGDGYGIITITVENGSIVDAQFEAFTPDGSPKDENYGKDGSAYAVAQKAASTAGDYAAALVDAGSINGVDAISGATYLYDQFVEAAQDALISAQ